jgi:predicted DCC family thiol-disulfide oxidoreductase YuxK
MNTFVLARDHGRQFQFSALQGTFARETLGRHGLDASALNTFYVLEDYGLPTERVLSRARAGLRVLERLGGVWRAARLLAILPEFLLDPVYELMARSRYRIFGRSPTCRVPSLEDRPRFIEYE